MEILHKFKEDGYFTSELFLLLSRKKLVDPSEEIIPSEYEKNMRMSTVERLQNLNNIEIDNIIHTGMTTSKAVLSFTPRLIVFQNFKPNDRIIAKFSVKNISKAPTFLNLVFKESSYFSIKPCGAQLLSRLAPGISVTFAITFMPVQYEDYIHRVTFHTDTDQYVLPLIAMGPRPIFDFPDEVSIPKVPLKVESYVYKTIHNIGTIPAGFTIVTKSPFSVQPKSAYLHPNKKIEIKITFKSMHLGEARGTIKALFETGETFRINVLSTAHTVSIELEKQVVRFLDTYNTMVRQQTFKIVNKSEHVLTYMCMKNDCVYYDFEEKVKLATIFYNLKQSETDKYTKLVQYNVLSSDEHERVYTRIFFDEVQALVADESLYFQNTHFSISPIKGKLWPKKESEFTITFTPKEIGDFEAIVYLDIDGVEDRIPLKMVGTSLPPSIHLNLETLDMDCVYINKTYNYEIVAINKGHINGMIVYKESPTLFGSVVTCTPEMHCLRPGDREVFIISFSNSNQGPYFEEINFIIRDTKVVLKLYLKGEVIYPSLMFSIPCLDFGLVSVGVPKTLDVEVINESVVNVRAGVKISSDGPEISSITLEDYAVAENPKLEFPQWPREFNIDPHKVELGPESRITIKVTLTANMIRANQTSLEMELEKSDSPPIILPVTYNAMVPEISPAPDINLRACFLDCPYKHEINLTSNEFWGYFTIDESEEVTSLKVDIGVKRGIIKPNSVITLPLTIITSVLGIQEYTVRMFLFGKSKPIDICHISGCGVRPIVTITPIALHWGQVKLLTRTQKSLTLCNDSPVKVYFKASLLNRDGRWQITPAEGYVDPESETDLLLSLYLLDADTYTNKAILQLEKVKDILVPLSATGVGTSIIVGELRDKVVLGRHFTKIPLDCKVVVENCGTRIHSLEWSEHYKAPKTKQHAAAFFNLEPRVFKLAAGEKIEMTITGISYKVTTVKEMWYLVGSVEGVNKKELLLECQVVAEFVDPKIEVSSAVINFQYDYGPYSEYYKLTDILTIKNVSKLPLDIDINVKPPFVIIQKEGTYKILPEEENLCCCIGYNQSDINVANIEAGQHDSKIFIDYLTLKPVEPLREGKLNFFQDINKIKMAFNLTHMVEERLEDQEVMKIQILFDTTKHLTLKSKVYCDLMRIKFKGHKNKDAVKLIGKINFPNMFVVAPRVDFQCILNSSIESKTFKIENVTPLLVCFKFQWKKCCITTTVVPEVPNVNIASVINVSALPSLEADQTGSEIQEILPSHVNIDGETDADKIHVSTDIVSPDMQGIEESASLEEEPDFESMKVKLMKKIAPMLKLDNAPIFPWTNKFGHRIKYNNININDVFLLTPHRGLLKPSDSQYVQVIFKPKPNINVRATLECEVLGGPSEYVTVTGQSSDLMYQINTQKLNFKIRSFHESAYERLIISNIAQLPFEYKTYLNEPIFENELKGIIRDLIPPEKLLEPEEEAEIKVVLRPGVVGYFKRVFLLEIGHLPHMPIEVFGWGVIPQVYLSLPRPEVANLDQELGYRAIPSLTIEYLGAVSEIFTKGTSEHLNSPQTEKCFEDPDFQQDWHICSSWDEYPSVMDIELAIERMLVVQHITHRPELLTIYSTTSRMCPIPGFHTSPYVVDFGVVITGSTVQCIAEIINYGPITTKLHFAKGTQSPQWLSLKLCGKLNPGETGKLEVVFAPTSIYFSELEQSVETSFNLEVPYGVSIPVKIRALCAVPYLVSNVTTIEFGPVRCGDKIVSSISLKNVGKPTCIWYVVLKLKAPGLNHMVVLDNSGKYEPGEGGWLSIAFKPTMEMTYEGMLIFRFHMNPNRLIIPVKGQGVLPHVHIIGPNVSFAPTLPWAETTDIYFGLTNPCPFPIELIIVHSDEKWKEEDQIYQLLYKYYNKPDEMLVPALKPGVGLPPEVVNFHKRFKETVQKTLEEETAAMSKVVTTKASTHAKKAGKSPKSAQKSTKDKENKDSKETSPRKFRTEAEIMADEIRSMKEEGLDPLKECLHALDRVPSENSSSKNTKGLLLFMYGSPCEETQCQEMAYTLGKCLDIPTINVDICIVEALCTSNCSAKVMILGALNEMYDYSRRNNTKEDLDDTEDTFQVNEDEFDMVWKKMEYLAYNKNIATPRSKISDKKKKDTSSVGSHTAMGAMGSSTMFQMDLVQELLTDFFSHPKFNRGFVIDSLTSIIVKNPPLVLTTVIKCKTTILNIHLVLCQSDFSKWVQAYEEILRENELIDEHVSKVYDESEIERIIEKLQDMDAEEFENAPADLKSIYINFGLEARRQKHHEKMGYQNVEIVPKKDKSLREQQTSKLCIPVTSSESKKKIKKDDNKANKPTNEYVTMNTRYNDYLKNTYENLVNIANNWIVEEAEIGYPLVSLNGQLLGASQKKSKKRSEIQIQLSEINFDERGFPLTLIMCPCLRYKDALLNMFRRSPLITEALKEEEEQDVLKCPVIRKEYTVLLPKTMPTIHYEKPLTWRYLDELPIKKCECNQITDLNLLDDSSQDNVLNILSKWHCTCGKKVTSSQTSTSEIPSASVEKFMTEEYSDILYPLPLRSVRSVPAHGARLVLQPGDLLRCKYSFSPQIEGNYSLKRFVEVSGWPESRADINVNGICDLPRLDNRPKKMFENFVRRTVEDHVYKITYLDDLKMFQFGPIYVGNLRIYEEEYTIVLKNSSLMTADVDIEFIEDTTVFQIDKNFIRLEPGCRGKLTISAAPAVVGVHSVELLFCVKNNPEIVKVTIACSGVVPIVEILPLSKLMDYGKLLLYRREDDRFIIKNDSILPIMWKIRYVEEFVEDFIIAQTSGIIQRNDNQVVPVTYIACNIGLITHKALTIDIYDELGRGEPMLVDMLFLSAECYDVMVECAYENPSESFLNYGIVKVNSTILREMYLLNRGKYNVYYKLKKVKNFPEPTLLKSFTASQECGVIPATVKLVAIEFECTPTTSMNLSNVPAYICSILDGSKDQIVVAKFPICVSIASFYNTFTLFPLGELNFHIIPVGSGVLREVILNNTSKCPFTYEIVVPEEYQVDPEALPMSLKGKEAKIKNPPIKCGNFLIMSEDNLLTPGSCRVIPIQFLATAARKFEETIKFIISDTCPAEANGVPLKLVGTGAIPILDFWNVETTFREHLIVKNLSEYKVHESSPHCVFVEDTVTLHFYCVTVNTSYTGFIDLYNNGLVPCALAMKLQYQSNTNNTIFSLDKYDTHIEPLMHKRLGIIFSPKALQEYRAVLDIKLKLLQNQEQTFKLCLIGEGVVPRIRLITPAIRQHRIAVLQFPVTCLGSLSHKTIRFKNISSLKSTVHLHIVQSPHEERPVFWLNAAEKSEYAVVFGDKDKFNTNMTVALRPDEIVLLHIYYNPLKKGRTNCDVQVTIVDNPYEYFMILCEAEAFMEDVILIGLEMLSMDYDIDAHKSTMSGTASTGSNNDHKKKAKSAPMDKKKKIKSKKMSQASMKQSDSSATEPSVLKYVLDFGGCELCTTQKRTVIMVNNSEKVYKFSWEETDCIVMKPSIGYISPGEEKDIEIIFFSAQPVALRLESLNCSLIAISDDTLTIDLKGATWDNRQTMTQFEKHPEISIHERLETVIDEQVIPPSEDSFGIINIIILYSVTTEYTKYISTLDEKITLEDTFIYQARYFEFKVENVGNVPMKITWSFHIDDEFPQRIDRYNRGIQEEQPGSDIAQGEASYTNGTSDVMRPESFVAENKDETSKVTLFSESRSRASVDTWFEVDLPFFIEPAKQCLKPRESKIFKVKFNPLEAFEFRVRLKSSIDNLDPYDQNIMCKIAAKSLIPYCHLDIEESDYLTSGRRKITGVKLPSNMLVLEFNVLGSGCYKKTFRVINPTSDAYEFVFEAVPTKKPELVPVHCNMLKGYVEGGTSTQVTFTFAPTAPGVYESQWKFIISTHSLLINLMVVGIVREPDVVFVPTIQIIRNSLVGFATENIVKLKNNENQNLNFEFKGNSLCNESGKTPVVMRPEKGVLKARSETAIKLIYTPIQDGPLSFKIFCNVTYLTQMLTLCVNALSHSIKPTVTYYLIGNEHILNSDAITNIHLDETASTYERQIKFKIKNDGSATFLFDWRYTSHTVKKYLQFSVEPKSGRVAPADDVDCILSFTLIQVPVQDFPLTLAISNGPQYEMYLHAEIQKPVYHFTCKEFNFGKCIVNAPDTTYKKNLGFNNEDTVPIILDLNFQNVPELCVDYNSDPTVQPGTRVKIVVYFRPKQVKEYEFKIKFWVNSLCEEIVTIKGEGVPLLVDLYEGCQKSFNLGPVKVGSQIIRQIEVMNHSKVSIKVSFLFKVLQPSHQQLQQQDDVDSEGTSICLDPSSSNMQGDQGLSRVKLVKQYKEDMDKKRIVIDSMNALNSLKVVPSRCTIKPHRKVPLKLHFKPVGMIKTLNVQLNAKILNFVKPLVRLSGSATGMSFAFSQNSIQFGRVRRRGCRIMKIMLYNKGDFGARFWWQPLTSDEFTIAPMQGTIAARTNVTFSITFRPINYSSFIKVWASCNIENYKPMEISIYATCMDVGEMQNKTMNLECPVREVTTEFVVVTNPSDETWLVMSEISGGPFETLREFNVEPNATFEIPIHFKPKTIGKHESQVLFSPLGETALFVTLIGAATHPNPNGTINIALNAKEVHTQELSVFNITEFPESYAVSTEVVKVIPNNFEGYYEINHPERIKTWGEATATCRWSFVCYEQCEMALKVMFVNEQTREYQFYNIMAVVSFSQIMDTITFECRARESVQKEIVIPNPLSHDAMFYIQCDKLQCSEVLNIHRHSETPLMMTYSPLVVGESEDYLTVTNDLVGTYTYTVLTSCLPAKEKYVEHTTTLGSCIPIRLRVQNKTEAKTDFSSTVTHASIITEKYYSLGPFEKGKFLVWFEPTELGVQNCRLSFNSPIAGEFVFNIKGIATEPKPQGPYEIKPGGFTTIKFKNVFEDNVTFKMFVDREEFYVKTLHETVKSKKDIKVAVYLSEIPARGWAEMPSGCFTIETYEPAEPKVQWTYFLQAIP